MHNFGRNIWLDLIRGCSALIVCIGHLRNSILVDFNGLDHPNIVVKIFYAMTSLGHEAVMVFFVLSGYFVGGSVLRFGINFSWRTYLALRLIRLWVVLIPCLLITWCIGVVLEHYSPGVLMGANYAIWHSGPKTGMYSADVGTFLSNVFFLQTIISPIFGANSPLWSLANEFWYYILFPLLAISVGFVGSGKYFFRAIALLLAMVIIWWLPNEILFGFIVWLMGVIVYLVQSKIQNIGLNYSRVLVLLASILFCFSLAYSKSVSLIKIFVIDPDIAVGLAFAFLCLMLTYRPFLKISWPLFSNLTRDISEMSYSLYLSHFPIVILIASIIYGSKKFVPDWLVMIQFLGWFGMLVGTGGVIWWLFESRTTWVRNKITSSFSLLRI